MDQESRIFTTLAGNYEASRFVDGIPSEVLGHFPKDQWILVLMALSRAVIRETAAIDWEAVNHITHEPADG